MGFTKKTWKNRIAEYINRRLLTKEDGSTELVTVARDEGTISQEGDAFNAANMNDLEDRIEAEFNNINQSLSNIKTWTKKQISENNTVDVSNCTEILFDINSDVSGVYSFIRITGKYGNYRGDIYIPYGAIVIEIDYSINGDVLTINSKKNVSAVAIYTK